MVSIPTRLPIIWIPDDRIHKCTMCGSDFSIINRKHHCRSCGKIFCSNCCFQYQSLPSYLPKTHVRFCDGLLHKVCQQCYFEICHIKKSRNLIFIFSLLPLTIHELLQLRQVSQEYKTASESVLGVFKALQYKVSYQRWSGMERRILKTHWKEFVGHSRLMVQAIRGLCGIDDIANMCRYYKHERKKVHCDKLFCSSKLCSNTLQPLDILELLCAFPSQQVLQCQEIESWVGTSIVHMGQQWLSVLLPYILQSGYDPPRQRIVNNNIVPLLADNIQLTYLFYFECKFLSQDEHSQNDYFKALLHRCLSVINEDIKKELGKTERLVYKLRNPRVLCDEYDFKDIRLPFDTSVVIHDIQTINIRQLNTYTKPWVVPLSTNKGDLSILVKHDDLRKDRFVSSIISCCMLLSQDISFHQYHCMPISRDFGLVEMIPNSISLFEINKTTTLTNYVIAKNIHKPMRDVRTIFIQSCASNCVLGYILGVGDRNLGNILVRENGSIVHIDFSYLLGTDPKSKVFTEMKITAGMVDLLGGKDSDEFKSLKVLCSKIYTQLRPYTYLWYTLFTYLSTCEPPIQPHHGQIEDLQIHIENRLMPESTEEEIEMTIIDVVDKNSGSQVAGWVDTFHGMKSSVEDLMFRLSF